MNDTTPSNTFEEADIPTLDIDPAALNAEATAQAEAAELEAQNPEAESPEANSEEPSLEVKYAELQNQYLRLAADFDNFRKRRMAEMQASRKYAAEGPLNQLLPVLDNLQRAEKSLTADSDAKLLFQTFQMLRQQLLEALEGVGLTPIVAEGQAFDPSLHEAVATHETTDQPDNTVLMVQQAGYCLHDKVLRPAAVVVASAPSTSATNTSATSVGEPAETSPDMSPPSEPNPFSVANAAPEANNS